MKHAKFHMPNLSYVAAFVIGVILFAVFWKMMFNSASSAAVAVIIFWLRNEIQHHGRGKQ